MAGSPSLQTKALARAILKNPVIRQSLKGYGLAYLYIILPRFLSIASRAIRKKEDLSTVYTKVVNAIRRAFLPNRFPAFIAKLIGGVFVLNRILGHVLSPSNARFSSAFISGICAFTRYKQGLKSHPNGMDTSDLTLFVVVRGLDCLIRSSCRKLRIGEQAQQLGDVGLFTVSCFAIMFAWFFYPERLPPSYRRWITAAANMDDELVEALRLLRNGEIVYGTKGKYDDILDTMCIKCGMDPSAGRFSTSIPLPCQLIHCNIKGCEKHAAWRWYRGFVSGLSVYVPLNIAVALVTKSWRKAWKHALISSARSSAFLATFITLCWYGVCLVRTRVGPKLFPNATAQQLEETYGPALGSALCGLSSLIEYPKRRGELALFVAPRALAIAFPDSSGQSVKHQTMESLLFALSFATLVCGVRRDHRDIRGVFQKLMTAVF